MPFLGINTEIMQGEIMKKILFLLVVCLSFTSCLSTRKVTGSIYRTRDKFQECNFYRNKNPFYKNKSMDLYVVEGTSNYVRVVFNYSGNDWIFFDRAIILNKKEVTINFNINSWDKETDVISEKEVRERADIVISREEAVELKRVLEGGFVRMRLQGKGSKTYLLKTKGFIELLDYYLEEM